MSRLSIRTLVIVASLLLSASAWGDEITLTVTPSSQFNYSASYDTVNATDHAGALNLAVGYELIPNLHVGLEYETSEVRETLFSVFDTSFAQHAALAAIQYSYPLTDWFRPHVRAGVGAYWGDLDIHASGTEYDATEVGFQAYAVGGFHLLWYFGDPNAPKARFLDHLGLSLSNDYGWIQRTSLNFDELMAEEDGAQPTVSLGELDMSGWTWRVGFGFRYRF